MTDETRFHVLNVGGDVLRIDTVLGATCRFTVKSSESGEAIACWESVLEPAASVSSIQTTMNDQTIEAVRALIREEIARYQQAVANAAFIRPTIGGNFTNW